MQIRKSRIIYTPEDLSKLYSEVINFIPFSITGHVDLKSKLHELYSNLVKSNFRKKNSNLTLLFSALLNIPQELNDDISVRNKIINWDLSPFNELFFKSFVSGYEEQALSFYFYMLDRFSMKYTKSDLKTSITLSKFFIKDYDFRVAIIKNKIIKKPIAKSDDSLFEIFIPITILNENYLDKKMDLTAFHTYFSNLWNRNDESNDKYKDEMYIKSIDGIHNDNIYKYTKVNYTERYNEIYEHLFNDIKINEIIEILVNEAIPQNKSKKCFIENTVLYKEIAYCSIALSFLSYYFDSYIEYMMSIAKVDYSKIPKEFRNIGGIIIGYNAELNPFERTMFNIISDRLASAVASEYLTKEYIEKKIKAIRKKRKDIYSNLDYIENSSIKISKECIVKCDKYLHGNECFDKNSHKYITDYINENKKFFIFIEDNIQPGKKFNKYFNFVLSPQKIKKEEDVISGKTQHEYLSIPSFLKKITWETDKVGCYANFGLIEDFFSHFLNENEKVGKFTLKYRVEKVAENEIVCLELNIENKSRAFDKSDFIKNFSANNSGFVGCINRNYDLILSHGNIIIKIDNKEIFNLEKDVDHIEGILYLKKEYESVYVPPSKIFTVIFTIFK
jgi:hypothetical protein